MVFIGGFSLSNVVGIVQLMPEIFPLNFISSSHFVHNLNRLAGFYLFGINIISYNEI